MKHLLHCLCSFNVPVCPTYGRTDRWMDGWLMCGFFWYKCAHESLTPAARWSSCLFKWSPRLLTQATALHVRQAHFLSPFSHSLLIHPSSTFETPFAGYQMYFSYTSFSELNYQLQRLLSPVPWRGAVRTSAESMLVKPGVWHCARICILLCYWGY